MRRLEATETITTGDVANRVFRRDTASQTVETYSDRSTRVSQQVVRAEIFRMEADGSFTQEVRERFLSVTDDGTGTVLSSTDRETVTITRLSADQQTISTSIDATETVDDVLANGSLRRTTRTTDLDATVQRGPNTSGGLATAGATTIREDIDTIVQTDNRAGTLTASSTGEETLVNRAADGVVTVGREFDFLSQQQVGGGPVTESSYAVTSEGTFGTYLGGQILTSVSGSYTPRNGTTSTYTYTAPSPPVPPFTRPLNSFDSAAELQKRQQKLLDAAAIAQKRLALVIERGDEFAVQQASRRAEARTRAEDAPAPVSSAVTDTYSVLSDTSVIRRAEQAIAEGKGRAAGASVADTVAAQPSGTAVAAYQRKSQATQAGLAPYYLQAAG